MDKQLDIIIPIYNEAENLRPLVERIDKALITAEIKYKIIFVDDHSTDTSRQILTRLAKKYPVSTYTKQGARGKAYSILEGVDHATAAYVAMMDADLQYLPEVLPEMFKLTEQFGVVVAKRHDSQESLWRKVASRGFRWFFGKVLYGLDCDVQSGLKVFRRDILKHVAVEDVSPWTLDIPLLSTALDLGYTIGQVDMNFEKRLRGESKIKLLSSIREIGGRAITYKLNRKDLFHISPDDQASMIGAGLIHRGKTFITHTTLKPRYSAMHVITQYQKTALIGLLLVCLGYLLWDPFSALKLIVATLSFVYFADVLFNFYLILRSLRKPPEINITSDKIAALNDRNLPIYTILCPLYKEAHILPHFLAEIEKLEWPKEKLDVILLLEADDTVSIQAAKKMQLPEYVSVRVVPDSQPKTKPKACNYGLHFAKGEYLVIYDAEDSPDPLQLKKVYCAFQTSPDNVKCIQAKLNFYNPHQNLLTRFFTAEYSLWFDVVLTGLQSINTIIPLGGTSNHFKTQVLKELEGWDPFNVTEDCDLGVRLFQRGGITAVINSVTLEEANSNWGNWLRQRSRWIKGYMQTYLVHMRHPYRFFHEHGLHALLFQLVVGGKISFMLINPIMWLLTITYFGLYAWVGPAIESLYPTAVFYMAATSLVFGNFLFIFYYMIGAIKREQWLIVKWVFLVPIYWFMVSLSAMKALYELIVKPHYWQKTVHGLHLNKEAKETMAEMVVATTTAQTGGTITNSLKQRIFEFAKQKKQYLGGGALVLAALVANFLNFFFNSYLGRALDFENFAALSLVGSFSYLSTLISKGFGTTTTHKAGFFTGKKDTPAAYAYWSYLRRYAFICSVILTVGWCISVPFLQHYFNTDEIYLFIMFALVFLVGFAQSVDQGYLSGRLFFGLVAVLTIFEPIAKNIFAFALIASGLHHFAYAIVPVTTFMTFLMGWAMVVAFSPREKRRALKETHSFTFPVRFFFVSMLLGLTSLAFLSIDVILAKHFLSAEEAGQYALLSLVGKMIYFLGGLGTPFIVPLVSRNEGAKETSDRILNISLLATAALTVVGVILLGVIGQWTVPLLYGAKAVAIVPYLLMFSLGMGCFSIAKVFNSYYLAKKIYSFPVASFLLTILQVVLMVWYNGSIIQMVWAMFIVGCLNLILMMILHLLLSYVKIFERNVRDFLELFQNSSRAIPHPSDKLAILILNWRDTKHKWAGGAEVYIHELAKEWIAQGHTVTVFCGNGRGTIRNEMVDGIQVVRRGGFYLVYLWAFLYYVIKFRGKFDVIIDCENGIPFFSPLYAREKVILLIHHVHQSVFRKQLIWPLAVLASFLEAKAMPWVYRKTEVVTVSPSSRKEILKHGLSFKKPEIIYNGINQKLYKPGKKSKTPLVLYVGRLQHYKSLPTFLEAAAEILKTQPKVEFVIAGDGEENLNLKKLAKDLGIADNITFTGKVSEAEKIELYQKAWVFVNPSYMEGWGITTIEANACGTPAVASDVPGLRDSIKDGETGFLVKYGSALEFATTITKLLNTPKLRQRLSKAAHEWSHQFSWTKSAEEFLGLMSKAHHHSTKTDTLSASVTSNEVVYNRNYSRK